MRSRYLILLATIGLTGSVNGAAADTADASQTAVWTSRELQFLGSAYLSPGVMDSGEPLVLSRTSSDQLYAQVRFVLRQLGARSIDLDSRGCWPLKLRPCVDVKFTVLAANESAGKHVLSAPVGAHWQLVQLGGNCDLLDRATRTVLPFFVTRNVKLISRVDCERLHVGLRAEVLKPSQELASTY
jgi:hypothetical protein